MVYEEGEILTQWILGMDYSIWLHYFNMKRDTPVHPHVNNSILTINYMLLGDVEAFLHGSGKVLLKGGKCRMFYIPKNIFHDAILPEGISSCLHVNFHPDHIMPLVAQYPVFGPILSQAVERMGEGGKQIEVDISSDMNKEIEKIIDCKLRSGERELFFQARVRDLLRMYSSELRRMQDILDIANTKHRIIAQIEHYIDQHLDECLSVEVLSNHFSISRATLQNIIAKKYKKGVHALIIERRMKSAAERLVNSDEPISNIVLETSDMTFAAFSTAFKKFHGMTPFEYRRRYSQFRKK